MKTIEYTCSRCGETYESDWSVEDAMSEYADNGFPPDARKGLICDDCYQPFMAWARKLGLATTAALLLCFAAQASAHCPADCPCVTPAPTATPRPTSTPVATATAGPVTKCPVGTPLLNLGSTITRVIPAGAKLIYCTRVQLAAPPNRIVFAFYETMDQDCGNLRLTVRQLSGAKQTKSSGPMSNGSVQMAKRVGQSEDPERVANGDYLLEFEGFPAACTNYLLSAGAL